MALNKFEDAIRYRFQDKALLEQALTHKSFSANHNEKMEFLGDSLLNTFVTIWLVEQFPSDSEGALSLRRSTLVSRKTLTEIGRLWFIQDHLKTSLPKDHYDRGIDKLMADAVEAVIAGVYLDAGWKKCGDFLFAWYESRIVESSCIEKHEKTALQEWLQKNKMTLPSYECVERNGKFVAQCHIKDIDYVTSGEGSNKQQAQIQAAAKMLKWLRLKK